MQRDFHKAGLLAAAFTFLVFLPSVNNDFVSFDDPWYVLENEVIRSLDPSLLRAAFTTFILYNWHPLTILSYAADYAIWGLDPRGYHLTNIALHAVNTFLVFVLAVRLLEIKSDSRPFLLTAGLVASVLFGIHPLHVESVSWISERKDVLSGLFSILSVIFYIKYATRDRKARYCAACLLSFILALMSKPMAVTLPAVFLILDFYPLERLKSAGIKRALLEKAPFFALSAVSGLLTVWAQTGAIIVFEKYPLYWRALAAVHSYIFYLYKMVLPVNLSPFYPLRAKHELLGMESLLAFLAFTAVSALCIMYARKRKVFLAAWVFYLITLFPVIGIVQVGLQAAADRYTYFPSIGPFILAGVAAGRLVTSPSRTAAYLSAAVLIFLGASLAAMTVKQESVWKDSVSFWTRAIELYPGKFSFRSRAAYYESIERYAPAIEDYSSALSLAPNDAELYAKRGNVYAIIKDYRKAIEDFDRAIELDPAPAAPRLYRGVGYFYLGRYEDSIADLTSAIEIDPGAPQAYYYLGLIYYTSGDAEKSRYYFTKAYELGLEEAYRFISVLP